MLVYQVRRYRVGRFQNEYDLIKLRERKAIELRVDLTDAIETLICTLDGQSIV